MSAHLSPDVIRAYTVHDVPGPLAWSVEAHLLACGRCREIQREQTDPAVLGRMWDSVTDRLDSPRRGPVERLLTAIGVPEHTARLLAATPSLRLSWFLATALVLAFAAVGGLVDGAPPLMLYVAPLLPLAGVAVAFGPRVDPAWELTTVAPVSGVRLLLTRAIAVLAGTLLVTGVLAVFQPDIGLRSVGWLLPALALSLGLAGLATWVDPLPIGASLGGVWMSMVGATTNPDGYSSVLFAPAGQVVFGALSLAAAVLIAVRWYRPGDAPSPGA